MKYVEIAREDRTALIAPEALIEPGRYYTPSLGSVSVWGLMAAAEELERLERTQDYFTHKGWKFNIKNHAGHRNIKSDFAYGRRKLIDAWYIEPNVSVSTADTWQDILARIDTTSLGTTRTRVRMTYTGTHRGWKYVREWARNRGLSVNDAQYGINCAYCTYNNLFDMRNDIRNRGWTDKIRIVSVGAPFQAEGNRILLQAGVEDLRSMKRALHEETIRRKDLMRKGKMAGENVRPIRD